MTRKAIILSTAAQIAAVLFTPAAQGQSSPPSTPPGGTTTTSVTYYATYKLDGGTATQTNQTYNATAADTSGVWVTNSGVLTLVTPTITTSGTTSSQDNSSFYGLNAGLLVTSGSATVTGGTITTTGAGANGAFATGSSATLTMTDTSIQCSADGGHGVMATQGGTITLKNVSMKTAGGSSGAIATDRGGGTIVATGGTITTSGGNSPAIYSTGSITVNNATMKATGSEAAVIEGANSITVSSSSLSSTYQKWGVMIYQSMSGDATGTDGTFTMTGGSLTYTPQSGPVFYVTNSTAIIKLSGVAITGNSGVLINAAAGNWGSSGSNGGNVVMTADGQTLAGNIVIDNISTLNLTLKDSSALTGAINNANTAKTTALTLDSTSKWTLTANSYLNTLSDSAGISGTTVTNIVGNGYNVYYDATLSANSYLGGKTYALVNGGALQPSGSATTSSPSITSGGVVNAASNVAGVAPMAWVTIYGTNLATSTATVTGTDLVSGYLPTTFGGTSVTINGNKAYLDYVSPTQLNVQAPADTTSGSVTVSVTNSYGTATSAVTMMPVQPGLFVASNYVRAVRPSDSTIINGTGASEGSYASSATAKPGDVLELFGTGLGTTTTTVAPGFVFSGAYATTSTPTVTIGGTPAVVSYSGLVGAGLYQINVTVPATLSAGTYPVVVTLGGVSSPTTAVLKVAN